MSKSKLSAPLKALINAPFARPNTLPASASIKSVYERLRQEAASNNVGQQSWLALSVSVFQIPKAEIPQLWVTRLTNASRLPQP